MEIRGRGWIQGHVRLMRLEIGLNLVVAYYQDTSFE
jgi:hypothetical protein